MMDFLTGRLCWTKCPSLFDFGCHIQYVCIGWVLLLLLIPVAAVVVWLLHQEGLFDPLYDWWDGLWSQEPHDDRARRRHKRGRRRRHHHHYNHRHHHGHGDHLHRHHHGTHAHHHPPPAWDVEGQHRHRRHHDGVVLGMQQQYNHRGHGEAVAAAPLRLDGPSRPRVVEDAVEFRERRRSHERDVGHGHRDRDRHGHYFQSV